jgi:hypothetical protein
MARNSAEAQRMRDAGVPGLLISADPWHQVFVPVENRLRCYRTAVAILGRENVAARDASREELEELVAIGRDPERMAEYARQRAPWLVGRAGDRLARHFPDRPVAELRGDRPPPDEPRPNGSCAHEFDPRTMWEMHVDPYGNVQTNCGVILGNVRQTPLPEQIAAGFPGNDLVRRIRETGPFGLLELAVEHGYEPRPGYPHKCHMCWEVRKFLRPHFPNTFGPAEIYPVQL